MNRPTLLPALIGNSPVQPLVSSRASESRSQVMLSSP
jgi:hypothetical protein